MAARRRKKTTRRRKSWSFLNALEAYTYAHIITKNTAGTSPWGFVTGEGDIGTTTTYVGMGMMSRPEAVGVDEISLADIVREPSQALGVLSENFTKNLLPMAIEGATAGISFRIAKRLLRRPIASVNRNLVKPALGAGIRL